jgi:hypothetical protein
MGTADTSAFYEQVAGFCGPATPLEEARCDFGARREGVTSVTAVTTSGDIDDSQLKEYVTKQIELPTVVTMQQELDVAIASGHYLSSESQATTPSYSSVVTVNTGIALLERSGLTVDNGVYHESSRRLSLADYQ